MKKLALLMSAGMIASLSQAQKQPEKEIPPPVKSAFQKAYPTAKEVKWEKENENFEADFEIGETDYSVLLDANGNILETEIEISADALPVNAKEYVSKTYAGQKIKEAAKITDAKGIVTYEIEIKGKDLIFDNNGAFIKEIKE